MGSPVDAVYEQLAFDIHFLISFFLSFFLSCPDVSTNQPWSQSVINQVIYDRCDRHGNIIDLTERSGSGVQGASGDSPGQFS